jgi:5'-3' exonuclease
LGHDKKLQSGYNGELVIQSAIFHSNKNMAKHIIVDTANLFYRCRHAVQGDPYSKAGLALHAVFRSIRKMWRDYKADHVVFCLEGHSWRYAIYPEYKSARKVARQLSNLKAQDQEEDQIFRETFEELLSFLTEKTNATVLQSEGVEGDDWVARYIQLHPQDDHLLVSGDTDFIQMLAPNVKIYDGVRELLISCDGIKDRAGQEIEFGIKSDGKLRIGKALKKGQTFQVESEWWKRALFMKCMRGDSGDSIFSAYPKVREKKLLEAWEDRTEMGYNWNNLMLQTWTKTKQDGTEEEVRVLDAYHFNQELIDLTKQPEEIKELMDAMIVEQVQKPSKQGIGIHFLRFCERNGLVNLSKEAADHAEYLNATYAK